MGKTSVLAMQFSQAARAATGVLTYGLAFVSVKLGNIRIQVTHSHNFARIHQSLRVTPAMEAGLADHVWEIQEIVALLEPKE